MPDNKIIQKFGEFVPWTDERIWKTVEDISAETGFIAGGEVQRRFIYDRNQTWRLRIEGIFNVQPASLLLQCLKLENDEEDIRRAFRAQASGSLVRPPRTLAHRAFDDSRGYGYSLDELVSAPPFFLPGDAPEVSTKAFVPFYRELRNAIREPFWPVEDNDAEAFSRQQFSEWRELAQKRNPDKLAQHRILLDELEVRVIKAMADHELVFRQAHLAGGDVRAAQNEWVVFANHFWSWRQPGYDLAFAIWNQWMALDADHRTADGVTHVTETWLTAIRTSLADHVEADDVRMMLLNRCFGSLILDIPAKKERHGAQELAAWESAVAAEAKRLLQ